LRDVLGFHANEVADMPDSTVESVNSALKGARASLQRRQPPDVEREPAPAPDSPSEQVLVAKFVRAYESENPHALVALLTDDVFISMPPIPLEYEGRDVVARLFATIFRSGRRVDLEPTRANGQPAFGPTFVPPPASAMEAACSPSPSPATGSAPSPASTAACSHCSGCRDHSPTDFSKWV
jgi:RNA polymerase sigma-70 factor (ECF subfamily)